MKSGIGHEAISASAGSGKTFQLAHRYIWLLANGVNPDRITALTFSRKAAGEIFDSVIKYLCEAASSPEQARKTGGRIGKPEFEQDDFLR
ncbi:MAG TPA: UvrD-helicase domain-containing protein, partial [Dehalococcoidia bacterium]|nr:UvrD-helicase domain-containing protein [Dehalococcoidia bacterium]